MPCGLPRWPRVPCVQCAQKDKSWHAVPPMVCGCGPSRRWPARLPPPRPLPAAWLDRCVCSRPARGPADLPRLCGLFHGVLLLGLGLGPVQNLTAHLVVGPWAESRDGRAIVERRGQGAGLLPQTGLSLRRGQWAVSSHVEWGLGRASCEGRGPCSPYGRLSTEVKPSLPQLPGGPWTHGAGRACCPDTRGPHQTRCR